jgi:hypothetical protein
MPANPASHTGEGETYLGGENAGDHGKVEWGIGSQVAGAYLRLYTLPTWAQTAL